MQGGCSKGLSLPCAYELVAAGRAGSRSQGPHGNLSAVRCICAGPHQPFVAPVPMQAHVLVMSLTGPPLVLLCGFAFTVLNSSLMQ